MLGTTRLETLFGAARHGFNTAGEKPLISLVKAFAQDGLAILPVDTQVKRPLDLRTAAQKRQDDTDHVCAGGTGESPLGYNLATADAKRLSSWIKRYRKSHRREDYDPQDRWGNPPMNFALVPDRSRCVVVDCDTDEEVEAFRNFFMDHTHDHGLTTHMDHVYPSVTSPGTVKGGHWRVAQEGYVYDDYGQDAWVPPVYENIEGVVDHQGGGHWYFFYPDGWDMPENAPSKITISYDSTPRGLLLQNLRDAQRRRHDATTQAEFDAANAGISTATAALSEVSATAHSRHMNGEDHPTSAKFDIMIKNCYVLIPPSSRYEGYYEVVSGEFPWEQFIEDEIIKRCDVKSTKVKKVNEGQVNQHESPLPAATPSGQHASDSSYGADFWSGISVPDTPVSDEDDLNEYILPWAQTTTWEEVLVPLGWSYFANDRCGCQIFTAPGVHVSRKSATAHDRGCFTECDSLGRLHFWTTNPPDEFLPHMRYGRADFTKLSTVAISRYDGDTSTAMKALGIELPLVGQSEEALNGFDHLLQNMELF